MSFRIIFLCLCYKLKTAIKSDPLTDVFKRIIRLEVKSASRETHMMWLKYIENEIQLNWVENNRRLNFKSCVEYLQYYSENIYFQDIKIFHNKSRIVRKTIHFYRRMQLFGKIRTSARDAAMPSPRIDSQGKNLITTLTLVKKISSPATYLNLHNVFLKFCKFMQELSRFVVGS